MATVTVRVDHAGIARLNGDIERWFRRLIRDIENMARRLCPVDSGALRASIGSTVTGHHAVIFARTDYAIYVHEGTGPHLITPTTRRALRFTAGGTVVYAAEVKHPGTSADPFLWNATVAVIGGL